VSAVNERRIAAVTGANRGIGLEVARQLAADGFVTVMGSREAVKGEAAAEALRADRLEVDARPLDVPTLGASPHSARAWCGTTAAWTCW
jgi:NAD(P)-dependent dehydrogenase (short-subunit alcohol dehydrogenase family)